jgi:hypothetical protein
MFQAEYGFINIKELSTYRPFFVPLEVIIISYKMIDVFIFAAALYYREDKIYMFCRTWNNGPKH